MAGDKSDKNLERSGGRPLRLATAAARWVAGPLAGALLALALAPRLLPIAPDASAQAGLGLRDVIRAVRVDLIRTQEDLIDRGEAPMFTVDSFDVELAFVVKRSASAGGEAGLPKFLVVSANSQYQAEEVQRISIHMSVFDGQRIKGPDFEGAMPTERPRASGAEVQVTPGGAEEEGVHP